MQAKWHPVLNQASPGTNFAGWIGQIVRLTALNYAKKSIRRHTVVTEPVVGVTAKELTVDPIDKTLATADSPLQNL